MFVVASTIISKREEFFLDCVLESVKEAVDLIIINDNSDDKENPNLKIIKNSNLYKQDKVKILFNKFNGFAEARNQILDFIKSLNFKDLWILKLDCDEAHTHELKKITRNILPKLPFYVGGIDCYYYHFIQSFDYYYSIDRRHNFLVRFNSELFWEGRVHEKLKNVQGKILVTPYLFFHYGAVIPRSEVLEKWKLYAYLGDKTFGNLDDSSYILNYEARFCLKFNKVHPQIMQGKIKEIKAKRSQDFEEYAQLIKKSQKKIKIKLMNLLRDINYKLRIFSRYIFILIWKIKRMPWKKIS